MKCLTFFAVALAIMAGLVAFIAPAPGRADGPASAHALLQMTGQDNDHGSGQAMKQANGQANAQPAAPYVTEMPEGYREWKWISSAHEAGKLNSFGALLGNDVAFNAFRDGKYPLPDGSMLVALHYKYVTSDENNKIFGQVQSYIPGAPTNIQFMVKDSTKYSATGGWGFGHFQNGKPATAAFMKPCFPCHQKAASTDLVFTRYTP
jgi:Cytochrome P460